jgi:hypothetical protein
MRRGIDNEAAPDPFESRVVAAGVGEGGAVMGAALSNV